MLPKFDSPVLHQLANICNLNGDFGAHASMKPQWLCKARYFASDRAALSDEPCEQITRGET